MLQLTYISTATRAVTDGDIDSILAGSRTRNTAARITGMLLYDGKRFLQALEGETDAVNRVYERIKADERHRGLVLLSSKEVSARAFGNWSMAAQRVALAGGRDVPTLVDQLTEHVSDRNVRELFRSFAQVRAAA